MKTFDEVDFRNRCKQRGRAAFETDVVTHILRALGRSDLMPEVSTERCFVEYQVPDTVASMNALWNHPEFCGVFPMKIQVWTRQCQSVEPNIVGLLKQLRAERPDLDLADRLSPNWNGDDSETVGVGVVALYAGAYEPDDWRSDELVILHNRPNWSKGKPIIETRHAKNGVCFAMHRAEPFIEDLADECRDKFAEDGTELYELIESNFDFREADWEPDEER